MLKYDPRTDAYSMLGVHPEADRDEIEAAYRRAVLKWHPDKSPAPDAADWFMRIQEAGTILRDPVQRKDYDFLRRRHFGARKQAPRYRKTAPEPFKPVPPAPDAVAERCKVIRDAVLFNMPTNPRRWTRELGMALALVALGAALVTANVRFTLLALVGYAIARIDAHPPSFGKIRWAKVIPGSRRAECATLDDVAGHFVRYDVPYRMLAVAMVAERQRYRVEIQGFPVGPVTLLPGTRDLQIAQRCAREVSRWLDLPLRMAA